ncbi:response regulator transcription factor [Thaumasiovibrio subtropicus]|uniref:response regulator transcription factor n=1 Tax=Thaumasiovibrio subtropicus TaxID=1891207 RepID=UPI000B34EEAB|nr:response regulator transcription factor [Thaumasiovibrio subtropicus]
MKVLIVEDNHSVAETITDFLELEQIEVDCAYHGESALQLVQQHYYDVIVMDIMMPKLDGISTVHHLRQQHCQTPILFLTAKDGLNDKQAAFDAGGDDYLVKPFAMEELLMRLRALTRRGPSKNETQLQFGDLTLNTSTYEVSREGKAIKLNHTQFKILALLIQRSPAIVSRQQVSQHIWGDETPSSDALRSHIYGLRQAIDRGFDPAYLDTIHGQGYRLKLT